MAGKKGGALDGSSCALASRVIARRERRTIDDG